MGTNVFVEIDTPEASLLADYTGIQYDLSSAQEFARMLLAERTKERPNWSLAPPLTIAVMVQYARSFATGVRMPIANEILARLTPEQLTKHKRFLEIRNKHVAHSVNTFEESRPVARYWVERVKEEGISDIQSTHHRIIGLSEQDLEDVIELTAVLLANIGSRIDAERARLLQIVRTMPLDKVLVGRRDFVLSSPDPAKPRRSLRQKA